jgi:hypothetical protein
MSAAFARNLEAQLNHSESGKRPVAELDAGSLFFSAAWARIRRFIRTLLGG